MEMTYYPTSGCNSYTGYGRLEVGLAGGLHEVGACLKLRPTAPDEPVVVVGYARWLRAPHVRAHRRRWLLTMSESDRVSAGWVEEINRHAAGVLVTCAGLVDVYRESGVVVPVVDVGMAVELDRGPDIAAAQRNPDKFRFLTYSYGDLRKGAELAVVAFKKLFHGNDRVELVIKARDNALNTWLAAVAADPQITVVGGAQDEDAWLDLLESADCFVFPSRGEGYGLPPREATLMGVPTIATEWLGMADVAAWGLALRVKELRTAGFEIFEANAPEGRWAEPDDDHLKALMAWVYDNPIYAQQIARHGRTYLHRQTWAAMARRVLVALDDYKEARAIC